MLSSRRFYGLICALLLALCGGAFAADGASVFEHPVTAATKADIARSLEQMTRYGVVVGDFKQTKAIKKLNREFVSTGTFSISKVSGVVWKTQKPFPSELTVSDSSITERSINGSVRTISTKDNPIFAEFSKVIKAMLFGNIAELEANFKLFYEGDSRSSDGRFRVGLIPREKSMQKVIANIVMDASKSLDNDAALSLLNRVVVTDADGNPVTYEFSNQTVSK